MSLSRVDQADQLLMDNKGEYERGRIAGYEEAAKDTRTIVDRLSRCEAELDAMNELYNRCLERNAALADIGRNLAQVLREISDGGWNDVIEPVALARSALTVHVLTEVTKL